MKNELTIINKTKDDQFAIYYQKVEELFEKTLKLLNLKGTYALSLIIVGPITIKRINRTYRHIDKVTDVISFALLDEEDPYDQKDAIIDLGDIFINRKRVLSQAQDYDHSIEREFCFLFVHGLLHCLGYDHQNEADEKEMLKMQKKILGKRR